MKIRFKMLGLIVALMGTQAAMAQKIAVQAITQVAPNLPQYTKVDQPLLRDGIASAHAGPASDCLRLPIALTSIVAAKFAPAARR